MQDPSLNTQRKPIFKIDATGLSNSSCFRKFVLSTVYGFNPKKVSINITFGSAVHKFNEHFHKYGVDHKDHTIRMSLALNDAQQSYLDALPDTDIPNKYAYLDEMFLTKCCMALADAYKNKPGMRDITIASSPKYGPMVEQKFAIPLIDKDSYALLLCGTFDQLSTLANGCNILDDLKTSSSGDIKKYLEGYRLSTQLMTYYHAIQWHAKQYPDSVYAKMTQKQVGVRIIVIHTQGKDKDVEIIPSSVTFFDNDMYMDYLTCLREKVRYLEEWLDVYVREEDKMSLLPAREGLVNGSCQAFYGPDCPYFYCCSAPVRAMNGLLKGNFEQKPYDPLKFR